MLRTTRVLALGWAIILAMTSFAYWGSLSNGWVDWDDYQAIVENPAVTSFDLAALAKGATGNSIYAPVTWITFAVLGRLAGFSPAWFHAFDLGLHLLSTTAVMIFALVLARQFLAARHAVAVALGSALLFGIHPIQVEAVAWATARKDTLSTFFFLLALLSYQKPLLTAVADHKQGLLSGNSLLQTQTFRGSHGPLTTLLYALALLSKPNTVVFPCVALAYDWLSKGRLTFGDLARKGLWLGMALGIGLVNVVFQSSASIWQASGLSLAESVANAVTALAIYLQKLVVPYPLAITYGHPALSLGGLEWAVAALTLAVVGVFAVRLQPLRPLLAFTGVCFITTLLPVLRVVPFGNSYSLAHDRFLYLPSVGGFVALAVIAVCAVEPLQRKPLGRSVLLGLAAFVTAYIAWLGRQTVHQVSTWKNSESLWQNVLRINPEIIIAHTSLGTYALSEQRPADALRYFDAASKLPDAKNYTRTILTNQAIAHGMLGDHARAATVLQELVKGDPSDSTALTNLGISYFHMGSHTEAKAALEHSLKLKGDDPRTHHNLGLVLLALGNRDSARRAFDAALALDPHFAPARRERNAMTALPRRRLPLEAAPAETLKTPQAPETLEPTEAAEPPEPLNNTIHP